MEKKISPIKKKTLVENYRQCECVGHVWIAVNAFAGEATGKTNPFGRPTFELAFEYRLCIEGKLQRPSINSTVGLLKSEAALHGMALVSAFDDFRQRIGCEDYEQIKCSQLAIISNSQGFNKELEERVNAYDTHDESVSFLVHFKKVIIASVPPSNFELIRKGMDFQVVSLF